MATVSAICKKISRIILTHGRYCNRLQNGLTQRFLGMTPVRYDLMEFFDVKENWGAREVKHGRSWTKDDLRLKSNMDLHKLWYVLLKERNMLLTMEQECKENVELFPSPERLDKVEESMENLESVVRERNKAYYQLETGETGERPEKEVIGPFGLPETYKMSEYPIPKHLNTEWQEKNKVREWNEKETKEFLLKYREKQNLEKRKAARRNFNHVIHLMNRFPNLDMEAVKQQFPDVDIEKAKASRKFRPIYYRE